VPNIVYLGPAFAGKRRSLEAIARDYDGELAGERPVVELRVDQIVATTVTGLVFEDAARLGLLQRADAVVFVADVRVSRSAQVVEMWENVADYLERAGRPANTPVVIQWSNLDAPDARPIEEVEQDLQIQSMIRGGDLRMPNPYALRYPVRTDSPTDAFDAATRAAVHGPFEIPPDAADFAKAMLDQQIASRIATLMPGDPDANRVAKGVVRGDEAAREQLDTFMRDSVMGMLMERFESDPELQKIILDTVAERMESSVLAPDLRCARCKSPAPPIEISGVSGGPFAIGDALEVDLARLSRELDWLLREPQGGEVVWLTNTECLDCKALNWCALTIHDRVLTSVWPVAFSRATYQNAHIANAGGLQIEAARLLKVEPDSLDTKEAIVGALEQL
jgi:hypothetical protein